MSGRLEGQVALITGAARGQGAAIARLFVSEGAGVVVTDVLDAEGRAVAAELGDAAAWAPLDVRDAPAWQRAVQTATSRFGRLDILVNNAGIGIPPQRIEEETDEGHRFTLDTNLTGVWNGIRAVVPVMAGQRAGSIVNTSSIDGIVGVAGMASYTASKFAVTGLTRSAALELGSRGIRVNAVHPGVIDSPMVQNAPAQVRARIDRLMAHQPIARTGTPEEVAYAVLFFACRESSYCTGASLVVDGGHIAGPWREGFDD